MNVFCASVFLLALSGDVELNPGPPRRIPTGPPGKSAEKGPSKEDQLEKLESKVRSRFQRFPIDLALTAICITTNVALQLL